LATICATYQSVAVEMIQELLGLSNIDSLIKEHGFRLEGNQLKLNQHDPRSKQKKNTENLKIEGKS